MVSIYNLVSRTEYMAVGRYTIYINVGTRHGAWGNGKRWADVQVQEKCDKSTGLLRYVVDHLEFGMRLI